jgi:16S rRNA processing protein RimM
VSQGWITVARLVKARGIRGEVAADPLTANPDRFGSLRNARVFGPRYPDGLPVEVENYWEHGGRVILKFSGINDMSAAQGLAGGELRVPEDERPEPPEGEFYQSDLVGCSVVERDGAVLGEVAGIENYGAGDLLSVRDASGAEILIPFRRSMCVEIDPAAQRIVVDLPPGLKELGRG